MTYHSTKVFLSFLKYFYTWFFPTKNKSITLTDENIEKILNLTISDIEKMLYEKIMKNRQNMERSIYQRMMEKRNKKAELEEERDMYNKFIFKNIEKNIKH